MAFLSKKTLKEVSDKVAPSQDERQSDGPIDLQTRQAYLEGCILAVKKNGNIDSEDARRALDAVGRSLKMGKDEIAGCYDVVSSLSSTDENEFEDMVVAAVRTAGLSLRFLFDVETCVSENCRTGSTTYELIYRYARGVLADENIWRVQALDLAGEGDKRKRWIDCCRQAANVWSAHDAQYALAYWHFNGIDVGLDDREAEKLYEQSAKKGNAKARKAVDAIKAKRAEEARIRAEKEAQRRAAEERQRKKEEAAAKRRAEEAEAKRRAKREEMLANVGKGLGCLLPIILVVWLICHWHNKKIERINAAADNIMQSMVSIPGAKFKVGKTEVTQAQWYGIMGKNPSWQEGDNLPVVSVSWNDCQDFIERLNDSEPVKRAGVKFRLPSEMEWEYACRAGGTGDVGLNAKGQPGEIEKMGWFNCDTIRPVATKEPNAFGIYDMHGNVFEWCSDAIAKNGWLTGKYYVYVNKGGSYDKNRDKCLASYRDTDGGDARYSNTGLRLACD